MNSVDDLIQALTPSMVNDLRRALELSKFPDGRTVSPEQKEMMLEAIIRYEALHVPVESRTGYVDKGASNCDVPQPFTDRIPTRESDDD